MKKVALYTAGSLLAVFLILGIALWLREQQSIFIRQANVNAHSEDDMLEHFALKITAGAFVAGSGQPENVNLNVPGVLDYISQSPFPKIQQPLLTKSGVVTDRRGNPIYIYRIPLIGAIPELSSKARSVELMVWTAGANGINEWGSGDDIVWEVKRVP